MPQPAANTGAAPLEARIAQFANALESGVDRVVKGQPGVVRHTLVALLVGGHVLLEGNPGTAKTLLVRTLARLCTLEFRRIQFTPDLMPSDITGTSIFRPDKADFEFRRGPVFTQLLLADEINRAPARTQAALLQAMQERIVSADGADYPLHELFTVVATQNPLENEGTYPLPEAELDRFLFKLLVDYPAEPDELEIFRLHGAPRTTDEFGGLIREHLFGAEDLQAMRRHVLSVEVRPEIAHYTLQIIRQTREHPFLRAGASTRAGVMLLRASRALAATYGRAFVVPDDVRELAPAALRHRLYRTAAAELEGTTTDTILQDIVARVPVPR
ncbi:MAG: MoxR family ATPase [Planctomycetes bacterium]|nr:MoxR family ATPase [Planctomycetota bacterium]MCL4729314.1 MoxR family ATPase [Planctomycetota bacterium]